MKLPRTRRETLTDKIAHTETFRDPSHQENAEKSDTKHLLTDSRHQENAEKSDTKHLLTDSRHQKNAEKSYIKHLLTDSRHQENVELSFKDFAYCTMNPEAHGHWELVVSSINEDGKALFSEKFKAIPESLDNVNQYVKPLLRDVMNVIQSVVKSDLVNKPTH
ncbi:hypothetical protein BgiMline_023012 [Biomphalaria glabrata]|nr:hypothetical protein BgiMline_010820 [Biomphalaria glabrata]